MNEAFTSRIGVVPISMSMFEDRHGVWAKRMEDVRRVFVAFEDGYHVSMTRAQYNELSREHRQLIISAPSGRRPQETEI